MDKAEDALLHEDTILEAARAMALVWEEEELIMLLSSDHRVDEAGLSQGSQCTRPLTSNHRVHEGCVQEGIQLSQYVSKQSLDSSIDPLNPTALEGCSAFELSSVCLDSV